MKNLLTFVFVISFVTLIAQHPPLCKDYQLINYRDRQTGQIGTREKLVGYKYGDQYIANTSEGRKQVKEIMKLEPKAYKKYKAIKPLRITGVIVALAGGGILLYNKNERDKYQTAYSKTPPPNLFYPGLATLQTGVAVFASSYLFKHLAFKAFNKGASTQCKNAMLNNIDVGMYCANQKIYPSLTINF